MPKLIAPHGASWRGRALDAGEIVDVTETDAKALAAHGFREVEDGSALSEEQGFTGTADVSSASGNLEEAGRMPAVPVELSLPEPTEAGPDIAALSRKELLKRLAGQGLGNLFVKSTDELRALAAERLKEVNEVPHGAE